MNRAIQFFAIVIGLILPFRVAVPGSATWLANPGSGDWNTASNWTPGGPPNSASDTATFVSSTVSSLWLSEPTQVNGIVFSEDAETPYIISASALTVFGSGITNNSGIIQNFIIGMGGAINFGDSASAGSDTVFTMGGEAGDAGSTEFYGDSTAGTAVFTINGCNHEHGWGGRASFRDNSTAANATIVVNGSAFQHCVPCLDDPYPQGVLFLYAAADNATIIANGGTNGGDGGWIRFQIESTGGTARVKVFGNGNLDISNHNLPGITIGSLEGDGIVYLGANTLTVGGNNLSTNFSGTLQNGSPFGGNSSGGALTKIGIGTLILSGSNTYTGPTTVNRGKLDVEGVMPSAVTINDGGTLSGSATTGNVTINSGGMVSANNSQTLHVVGNYVQSADGVLKIEVAGSDPTASGHVDVINDATLSGTLEVRFVQGFLPLSGQVFKLLHLGGTLSGSFAQIIFPDLRAGFQFRTEFTNGDYQITALSDGVGATGFVNISTRMQVGTGDEALIGGFIVTGNVPKRVIVRAIGPSLAQVGVPDALADPTLEIRDSAGGLLFSNDNWMESTQVQEIIDSGIPPTDEHEAAIVATLAPGNYTAVMRGVNNSTGIGVVEVYDLAQDVPSKLANISTRGFVETGDNAMIGGFIANNQAMHVMVRALGPSLMQSGVPNALADPTLELHDGQGAVIAYNDDWRDSDAAAIESTGIPPSSDKESAILATLAPSNYTAIVRGQNDTVGVALVEFYDLQ